MSLFPMLGSSIGGLGLFVLGMWLMSEGLKSVAGSSLNRFLHHWTKTPVRGLGMGFALTSLIQSSSAITVTVIGFANAGLLSLKRAIWIIFGSNIGTTTTGWLVTLIGFNVKISGFALPLIGIGMVLKLSQAGTKLAAIGQAMVGFGILFLGIAILKDTFAELGQHISLASDTSAGIVNIAVFTGIGFLITVLMQSSSVTLAITLSALSGGVISLIPAAAIVVGGNLGTTTTAVLASIGTSSTAKRVVASHVIFNIIGAVFTLILLSPLLSVIQYGQQFFAITGSATTLALFHTTFNILAVLLIWPVANYLIQFLAHRFISKHENKAKPLYLNKQSLSLPSLALHALCKELERVGHYTRMMAKESITSTPAANTFALKNIVIDKLVTAIGNYTSKLYKQNLDDEISEQLPFIIRVSQYYDSIAELSVMINEAKQNITTEVEPAIEQQLNEFYQHSLELLDNSKIAIDVTAKTDLQQQLEKLENEYQALKALLLRRGAEGSLSIAKMDKEMTMISYTRRINQQAVKAFLHFSALNLKPIDTTEHES